MATKSPQNQKKVEKIGFFLAFGREIWPPQPVEAVRCTGFSPPRTPSRACKGRENGHFTVKNVIFLSKTPILTKKRKNWHKIAFFAAVLA
ncbi:MAG: hypothetical protein EOM20_07060 [Spartobacteria bacterium]|nr:hypothetical protein [Spartobacteria bacterium]